MKLGCSEHVAVQCVHQRAQQLMCAADHIAYMKDVAPFLGVSAPDRRRALRGAWAGLPPLAPDDVPKLSFDRDFESLLDEGRIPVISSVARGDDDGQIYNVNADQMAVSCASGFTGNTQANTPPIARCGAAASRLTSLTTSW